MKYYISEYQLLENTQRTAGSKARDDVERVFESLGFEKIEIPANQENRRDANKFLKLKAHITIYKKWKKALENLKSGDSVIIQFPNIEHSILIPGLIRKLRRKKIKIVLLIHDLELLRTAKRKDVAISNKIRLNLEEKRSLKYCNYVIAHNVKMKKYLCDIGITNDKIITLSIFDYLIDRYDESRIIEKKKDQPIIIAGNLRLHKAKYVYNLPDGIKFNLYGVDYTGRTNNDIVYHGSFEPEELIYNMSGSFGLVWDGDSSETCSGVYGEYLKINNPHKTSLYLAAGIPVVIWDKAALALFVEKYGCGITVSSLKDIDNKLKNISDEEYAEMRMNACKVSKRLREGYYIKRALSKCNLI